MTADTRHNNIPLLLPPPGAAAAACPFFHLYRPYNTPPAVLELNFDSISITQSFDSPLALNRQLISNMLEVSKLTRVFKIYPSLEAALA